MKIVRAALLLSLALASCAPTSKAHPGQELKSRELAIVMAVGVHETSQLKTGQWALYSVKSEGSSDRLSTRLAVVGAEGKTFWIENRTTTPGPGGRPQSVITKYQVDASANKLQLWAAEHPGGRPVKIFPGTDAEGNRIDLPKPAAPDPNSKVEIAQERITTSATGRPYECTRLTSRATYPGGRETTLVTWCSKDVPFPVMHNGKSYGGVVRRTYGEHMLELDAKGNDAVAELQIPDK